MQLHGLSGSSSTWLPVMSLLGAHTHVIAPDLLGHGLSAKPHDGDYSLGTYAAGPRDLIVALGLDQATVVGHSSAAAWRCSSPTSSPSSWSGWSWWPAAASAAKLPRRFGLGSAANG